MLERNKIYCMDCLEGMRQLEDKSVDLVLTDPPYGVGMAKWDKYIELDGWFYECERIGKQLIFTPGIRNIYNYPKPKWILSWVKQGSSQRNDTGGFNHWEPLLYYGNRRIMVDTFVLPMLQGIHNIGDISISEMIHPCPKPLKLFYWLVDRLTDVGDLVVDPFLGSGTTAVACKQLGRDFIGFEINQEYVDIANKRLEQEVLKSWIN